MYPKCRCYIWLNPVVVLLTCLLMWMAYSSLQLFPNEREPEKVIIFLYTFQQILSFMSISDKERSTTGKNIWLSMHTRKFDSHVTERRPPDRPQHRENNKSFLASMGVCNFLDYGQLTTVKRCIR